jgi:hypothetical protein
LKIKSLLLFSLKLYSILSFRYRAEKLKRTYKISPGDLVKIKQNINTKSGNSLTLRCPKTGKLQNKIIEPGTICVFIGIAHRIEMDSFPRAVILHDGILSFISNHQSIENTLVKLT